VRRSLVLTAFALFVGAALGTANASGAVLLDPYGFKTYLGSPITVGVFWQQTHTLDRDVDLSVSRNGAPLASQHVQAQPFWVDVPLYTPTEAGPYQVTANGGGWTNNTWTVHVLQLVDCNFSPYTQLKAAGVSCKTARHVLRNVRCNRGSRKCRRAHSGRWRCRTRGIGVGATGRCHRGFAEIFWRVLD
jgi:hypothetical protein